MPAKIFTYMKVPTCALVILLILAFLGIAGVIADESPNGPPVLPEGNSVSAQIDQRSVDEIVSIDAVYTEVPDLQAESLGGGTEIAPSEISTAEWGAWEDLGMPQASGFQLLNASPGATSMVKGELDVYWDDSLKGRLVERRKLTPTGSWIAWNLTETGGYEMHNPVGVTSPTPSRIDVFALGANSHHPYRKFWYSGAGWSAWTQSTNFDALGTTGMGAFSFQGKGYGAMIRASDRKLCYIANNGTIFVWGTGGSWTSSPAACTEPESVSGAHDSIVHVFARNSNGRLGHMWLDEAAGRYGGPEEIVGGSTLGGAPTVVSRYHGQLDVFYRKMDGSVVQRSWNSATGWTNEVLIAGGEALLWDPAVVSWSQYRIDLFSMDGGNNNIEHIPWQSPLPHITQISPSTGSQGVSQVVEITGTTFYPNSQIKLNSTLLPASAVAYVRPDHLHVTIPAGIMTGGTHVITVVNPADGVGGGGTSDNSVNFYVAYPTAQISSLTPASVEVTGPDIEIGVAGSNFVPGVSTFLVSNVAHQTTVISSSHLHGILDSAHRTTVGSVTIQIKTDQPGPIQDTLSSPVFLPISRHPNPVVNSFSPPGALSGSPPFTLTLSGSNFIIPESTLFVDGVSRSASWTATTCQVPLTSSDLGHSGTIAFQIKTSNPGSSTSDSGIYNFPVGGVLPTITSLTPGSCTTGTATTLEITGTNYSSTYSGVRADGVPITTSFQSATHLHATLPGTYAPGSYAIGVFNSNDNMYSSTVPFYVYHLAPSITAAAPSNITKGAGDTNVLVTGTNFDTTDSAIYVDTGTGFVARSCTFPGANQMSVLLYADELASAGTISLQVRTTNADGSVPSSNEVPFYVLHPAPSINSTVPRNITMGSGNTDILVTGTNFDASDSMMYVNTGSGYVARTCTFPSANQMLVPLYSGELLSAGTISLQVRTTNPDESILSSNEASIAVVNPPPTVTSIAPRRARHGTKIFVKNLAGTNFQTGATFTLEKTGAPTIYPLTATRVSSSQITGIVKIPRRAKPGYRNVVVTNPDGGSFTLAAGFKVLT